MVAPQKDMPTSQSLEPVNVIQKKKIFADVIWLRISRWEHPGLHRWALSPMPGVLWEAEEETEGGEGRVQVEIQVLQWEAKEFLGDQNLEEARRASSLESSEGKRPCRQLDFGLLASRRGTEPISVVLSHLLWWFVMAARENEYRGLLGKRVRGISVNLLKSN